MALTIALMTLGTRGDVAPMLALGQALAARGHRVRVAGPDDAGEWVRSHGFEFHSLGFDIEAFLQSPAVREKLSGGPLALARIWWRDVLPNAHRMFRAIGVAAQGCDVIVSHPKVVGSQDAAEAQGALYVRAHFLPLTPTHHFPPPVFTRELGYLNRPLYQLFRLARLPYLNQLKAWRRELGLPPGPWLDSLAHPSLCAVSPVVLPRPSDWPVQHVMTGYWFFDEPSDWQPDPALADFLGAGDPPIYIGFGSMTSQSPRQLSQLVVEAVRLAGCRAVLGLGWGALEACHDERVHPLGSAPHHALFPLCSAVVHHGGAGTTAQGLRAGLPTLVCPFFADQPFWGQRVLQLGCGPIPLALEGTTAHELAGRLKELANPDYRRSARYVAGELAKADGPGAAAAILEELAVQSVPRRR